MLRLTATARDIDRAARLLHEGRLVAFPTETVYGLGADALDPVAVARVFAAKGRPADHPLIVHVAGVEQLERFARDVPTSAERLAAAFWPGPLTLILLRSPAVPDAVTGGQETVGVRVPSHPVARALLASFGGGIAAPSANRFGRVSPTCAEHVVAEFGDTLDVAAVIDGGVCDVGIESTIVDLTGVRPRVLRTGGVTSAEVQRVLGEPLDGDRAHAPRVSGSLASHYAPEAQVRLVEAHHFLAEAQSVGGATHVVALIHSPGVLSALHRAPIAGVRAVAMASNPRAYAHDIYAMLRDADAAGAALILVERPPASAEWAAVADRLARAAGA